MGVRIIEQVATVWMADEMPSRMVYAGQRWRVTDRPTRLRESIWEAAQHAPRGGLYGWRFQAENSAGESYVFDVFRQADGWHVHRSYD